MSCDGVFVLDSSLIIQLKREIKADRQWELAKHMEELVVAGRITFPPQVLREIRGQQHTDIPEAWALAVSSKIATPSSPGWDHVEAVMAVADDLIEADAEGDPADPYVVALALELREEGFDAIVATADIVDRPPLKISMGTACDRLALAWMDLDEFLRCMFEDLGWAS